MHIIEFTSPTRGLSGTFNTFRLGLRYSKLLKIGDKVILIDKTNLVTISEATVTDVLVGKFGEMAKLHAKMNHNYKGLDDAEEKLIESMTRLYGPHKIDLDKNVTVIYLAS